MSKSRDSWCRRRQTGYPTVVRIKEYGDATDFAADDGSMIQPSLGKTAASC